MKRQGLFGAAITRVLGVVLTAGFCLLLGTMAKAPEPPEDAELFSPLITPLPEYFVLSFVGDCTLASSQANKGESYSYEAVVGDDWAYPFALTRDNFAHDEFTFANLECALTNAEYGKEKTFSFRAAPAYVNILKEGGVDFVSLGNNHVLDCGEQGYSDTKAVLEEAGIGYSGRNEYKLFETKSGLKIGVYSDSFTSNENIRSGITALKQAGAEFVIAALHWGDEGSYDVNDEQREQGRAAVDAGADFVYGSHPHTLQPAEEYKGVYIFYSMGNWSFGGNTAPRDPDTIILSLTVERNSSGDVSIKDRKIIPCACTGVEGGNNYQPVPYKEDSEEYKRTMSKINGTYEGPNLNINYNYSQNE